jgi:hypothetical protein
MINSPKIYSNQEYEITKNTLENFKQVLAAINPRDETLHPRMILARINSVQRIINTLNLELKEYEDDMLDFKVGDVIAIDIIPDNDFVEQTIETAIVGIKKISNSIVEIYIACSEMNLEVKSTEDDLETVSDEVRKVYLTIAGSNFSLEYQFHDTENSRWGWGSTRVNAYKA